jgi:outer membrane murein-binding lipoprotein Lpp
MKTFLLISVLFLAGCATNPEVEKSISRDKTMNNMAKTALINEMLNSADPHVRARGAEAAAAFINPKKSILPF